MPIADVRLHVFPSDADSLVWGPVLNSPPRAPETALPSSTPTQCSPREPAIIIDEEDVDLEMRVDVDRGEPPRPITTGYHRELVQSKMVV